MTIRALVVDDEPLARSRMRRMLGDHPDVEVVGEAADGAAAHTEALRLRPDVVFLDVQMPGRTGTEALRAIQASLPESLWPLAVFTTAYEEHAVEAFALEGTDYLLKPVERDHLARSLRRVRKALWARDGAAPTPPPVPAVPASTAAEVPPAAEPGHLTAHRAGKLLRLPLAHVALVEVEDTITFAVVGADRHRLAMTLAEAEDRLPAPPFVRISRSAIVNLDWIASLSPVASGTYLAALRAPVARQVQISRRRSKRLLELFDR
jgi:two-component system, LytTR family, response regulator